MALISQVSLRLLVPSQRVYQKEAVRARAREAVAAMAPVARRDVMVARRTTIAFTRLQPVAQRPLFRAHGAGRPLLILNGYRALKKSKHRLYPLLLMGGLLSWLVRIAEQRSLRSGGEMSRDTPSAMLVVRLILRFRSTGWFLFSLCAVG